MSLVRLGVLCLVTMCVPALWAQDVDPVASTVFAEIDFPVKNIAVSGNGKHLVAIDGEGQIFDWNPRTSEKLQVLDFPKVWNAAPNSRGNLFPAIAFDSKDRFLRVVCKWSGVHVRDFSFKKSSMGESRSVHVASLDSELIKISEDSDFIWGVKDPNKISFTAVATEEDLALSVFKEIPKANKLTTIAMTTKEKTAGAVGDTNGKIRTFLINGLEVKKTHFHHKKAVWYLAFKPGRSTFVSSTGSNELVYWKASKDKPVKIIPFKPDIVSLTYSPKGKYFATGLSNGGVAIWKDQGKEPVVTLTTKEKGSATKLVFSHDDKHVYAIGYGKKILAWDLKKAIYRKKK